MQQNIHSAVHLRKLDHRQWNVNESYGSYEMNVQDLTLNMMNYQPDRKENAFFSLL